MTNTHIKKHSTNSLLKELLIGQLQQERYQRKRLKKLQKLLGAIHRQLLTTNRGSTHDEMTSTDNNDHDEGRTRKDYSVSEVASVATPAAAVATTGDIEHEDNNNETQVNSTNNNNVENVAATSLTTLTGLSTMTSAETGTSNIEQAVENNQTEEPSDHNSGGDNERHSTAAAAAAAAAATETTSNIEQENNNETTDSINIYTETIIPWPSYYCQDRNRIYVLEIFQIKEHTVLTALQQYLIPHVPLDIFNQPCFYSNQQQQQQQRVLDLFEYIAARTATVCRQGQLENMLIVHYTDLPPPIVLRLITQLETNLAKETIRIDRAENQWLAKFFINRYLINRYLENNYNRSRRFQQQPRNNQ